jgi:thiamine-phosphate pyrophosphorylase
VRLSFRLPRLYPILDTETLSRGGFEPEVVADLLLAAGTGILQYRHKGLFTEHRWRECSRIASRCHSAGALFIVNDRVDAAVTLQAGVHLGQDDLPLPSARNLLGDGPVIGLSTHNEQQLLVADKTPADYLAFGPVFPTGSKRNPDPVVGPGELRRIRSLTQKPLVAIGGISLYSAKDVLHCGADSIALISALLPAEPGDMAGLQARIEAWMKAMNV